jgi:hypothetical protein
VPAKNFDERFIANPLFESGSGTQSRLVATYDLKTAREAIGRETRGYGNSSPSACISCTGGGCSCLIGDEGDKGVEITRPMAFFFLQLSQRRTANLGRRDLSRMARCSNSRPSGDREGAVTK